MTTLRINNNNYPFEICDVDSETTSVRRDLFNGIYDGFVKVGPKGYFLPKNFQNVAVPIYNMETKPGQVFVGGYPRSGTTLTQQLVWLIIHDLDYAECEKTLLHEKFEYIEILGILPDAMYTEQDMTILTELTKRKVTLSNPFMKTHLPLSLLPPKLLKTSKMVYVARDPRDVVVSYYHYSKALLWAFKHDFKTFWKFFRKGILDFGPYFEHVKEFWKKRHDPNLLFLFYENIVRNRVNTLRHVAKFFNKSYTEEQLLEACRYLDFDNLQHNKSFNTERGLHRPNTEQRFRFIRKGVVGGWREYFDEEMTREADQWIADNLRGTDLVYPSVHII